MRRRDLLAGVGSVAALGVAGAVALRGVPSPDGGDGSAGESAGGSDDDPDRISVETIDAPGSEAGSVEIPPPDQPAFIDFFATWCAPCETQMPALATTHDRIGDDVLFISITSENVGRSVTEERIVEWWETNGGDWTIGIDPTAELAAEYNPPGYPYAVAIDSTGSVRWSEPGVKTTDELVAGIERALDDE
jgi:thiol-disulfide isomerase/thioredoxin